MVEVTSNAEGKVIAPKELVTKFTRLQQSACLATCIPPCVGRMFYTFCTKSFYRTKCHAHMFRSHAVPKNCAQRVAPGDLLCYGVAKLMDVHRVQNFAPTSTRKMHRKQGHSNCLGLLRRHVRTPPMLSCGRFRAPTRVLHTRPVFQRCKVQFSELVEGAICLLHSCYDSRKGTCHTCIESARCVDPLAGQFRKNLQCHLRYHPSRCFG